MFVERYPLARSRPAAYNPRRIDEASRAALRESLATLGLIRPIIVTQAGPDHDTTVAGHQRSVAMRALGMTHAPAFVLPPIDLVDEIRFNQLHNAGDKELADAELRVPPADAEGWAVVPVGGIAEPRRPRFAGKRNEILRLMAKYGEWSSVVATRSGEVLVGLLYASACRAMARPIRVYYVDDARRADVLRCFGREYGVFSYGHLPRTTWAQSLAQMFRLRGDREAGTETEGQQGGHSRTYEDRVIPLLKPGMRVLDFGAGQQDYAKALRKRGVDVTAVEFYFRTPGKMEIDPAAVHRDIAAVCRELATRGRFDLVLSDSVLNSVDSLQAEADVCTCLNALCRPGGTVVFSGRCREYEEKKENDMMSAAATKRRNVNFYDEHGFTALYQRGVWLYQKFHTREQAAALGRRYIGPAADLKITTSAWSVAGRKSVELPAAEAEASLAREFDLPWPNGRRVGRSAEIVAAYRAALAREGSGE